MIGNGSTGHDSTILNIECKDNTNKIVNVSNTSNTKSSHNNKQFKQMLVELRYMIDESQKEIFDELDTITDHVKQIQQYYESPNTMANENIQDIQNKQSTQLMNDNDILNNENIIRFVFIFYC